MSSHLVGRGSGRSRTVRRSLWSTGSATITVAVAVIVTVVTAAAATVDLVMAALTERTLRNTTLVVVFRVDRGGHIIVLIGFLLLLLLLRFGQRLVVVQRPGLQFWPAAIAVVRCW